jgi:hypothetical protein
MFAENGMTLWVPGRRDRCHVLVELRECTTTSTSIWDTKTIEDEPATKKVAPTMHPQTAVTLDP